jgi:hypothetical protein
MSGLRFLDLIKPFTPLLPEVAAPETKVPFNQKLMWTGVSSSVAAVLDPASSLIPSVDSFDLLGHEPNASVWYCLL